jgi:hypothetical protein
MAVGRPDYYSAVRPTQPTTAEGVSRYVYQSGDNLADHQYVTITLTPDANTKLHVATIRVSTSSQSRNRFMITIEGGYFFQGYFTGTLDIELPVSSMVTLNPSTSISFSVYNDDIGTWDFFTTIAGNTEEV